MTELTTNQIIKIILGILVFVAVIIFSYIFFKDYILDFFNNLVPESSNLLLGVLK